VSTTEVEVIVSKLLNGMGVVAYGVQVSTLLLTSLCHFYSSKKSWLTQKKDVPHRRPVLRTVSGSVCFWASWIRIHLVGGMDPDPDSSIIKKNSKKNFDSYCFFTSF
jgi:hypothetical protein